MFLFSVFIVILYSIISLMHLYSKQTKILESRYNLLICYDNYFKINYANITKFNNYLKEIEINYFVSLKKLKYTINNFFTNNYIYFIFNFSSIINTEISNAILSSLTNYYRKLIVFNKIDELLYQTRENKIKLESFNITYYNELEFKNLKLEELVSIFNDKKRNINETEINQKIFISSYLDLKTQIDNIQYSISNYSYISNMYYIYDFIHKNAILDINTIINILETNNYLKSNYNKKIALIDYFKTLDSDIDYNIKTSKLLEYKKYIPSLEVKEIKKISLKNIIITLFKNSIIIITIIIASTVFYIYLKLFFINLKEDIEKELNKPNK